MIRFKQVLITGVTMKRISEHNMLQNKRNKKQVAKQEEMKIDDDDVCEIIKEMYRRDKLNKEFDIGLISECEYDEDISENEEESSGDELESSLLVFTFVWYKRNKPSLIFLNIDY